MTLRFALPDVGEGLHEAEIVRWLVAVGETVARDQPIVEILTDKAQVELPSPAAGTIASVHAAEGDIVTVGTVIVDIDDGRGADAPPASPAPAVPSAASPAAAPSETTPVAAPAAATAPAVAAAPSRRPKASPSTRKLAARLGVDLRRLAGTGPGGRILAADVEAAHAGGPAPSAAPRPHRRPERPRPRRRPPPPSPDRSGPCPPAGRSPRWASCRPAPTRCGASAA
ncbi:MAG: biotin/lipoyl-containing protein [Acidimicrobiales bacterium]